MRAGKSGVHCCGKHQSKGRSDHLEHRLTPPAQVKMITLLGTTTVLVKSTDFSSPVRKSNIACAFCRGGQSRRYGASRKEESRQIILGWQEARAEGRRQVRLSVQFREWARLQHQCRTWSVSPSSLLLILPAAGGSCAHVSRNPDLRSGADCEPYSQKAEYLCRPKPTESGFAVCWENAGSQIRYS